MKKIKPWEIKEEKDAQTFKGRRVKGSGNKWYSPGDVKSSQFLIDSKQTTKNSYSLNWDTLEKLYEEALFSFRIPLLSVILEPPKKEAKEVVIMFKEDFEKLLKDVSKG